MELHTVAARAAVMSCCACNADIWCSATSAQHREWWEGTRRRRCSRRCSWTAVPTNPCPTPTPPRRRHDCRSRRCPGPASPPALPPRRRHHRRRAGRRWREGREPPLQPSTTTTKKTSWWPMGRPSTRTYRPIDRSEALKHLAALA